MNRNLSIAVRFSERSNKSSRNYQGFSPNKASECG